MKNLLGLRFLSKEEIEQILQTAVSFWEVLQRPIKVVPSLRGKVVVNLFFEPSTRTRISFEQAAKALSASVINFSVSYSSAVKGESLYDTVKTLEALGADFVVIRHPSPGASLFVAQRVSVPVINAGEGATEHPTQALLDMFALKMKFGKLEGLKVLIVGDIVNSRVARSHFWGLPKMGVKVRVCAPSTFLPLHFERAFPDVEIFHRIDKAVEDVDVVMGLRIQKERASGELIPSIEEYVNFFQIAPEYVKDKVLMHPGPVNRGVELPPEIVYGKGSIILNQVKAGVAVRMAVLYLLGGAK